MSGADDLRTAIAKVIHSMPVRIGNVVRYSDAEDTADRVIAEVIEQAATDPVRRLAILNLIGDVREGNEVPWSDGSGETFIQFDEPGNGESVFVVRPRGEATK